MKDLFDLTKKNIVVTGAAGYLGSRFCEELVQRGANVVIADVSQEKCEDLADTLNKSKAGKAIPLAVDLASESSVQTWAKKVLSDLGSVDVLVNNAAAKSANFFNELGEFPLEDWKAVSDVNVNGIFLTVREFGPHMAKRGKGSIINVSSIYGVVGPDQGIYEGSFHSEFKKSINTPLVYAATKSSVIGITKYLATYYGARGIRTNTLTPGGVSGGQNEEFQKRYKAKVPMRRMAEREDLLGALVYLASDASSYMNGQNLIVDGGFTAW